MKRKSVTLFITVIICLFAHKVLAQRVYVNISAGAATQMSSENIAGFYNYTKTTNSITTQHIDVSLGQGVNLGGVIGYMVNKNLGVELGISYLLGDKFDALNKQPDNTENTSIYSTMLRFNPSIVLATDLYKINPYVKFGFVIGSGNIYYSGKYAENNNITVYDFRKSGGLAYGVSAAIGAMYKLNEKISILGEISSINLSYAPTEGLYTYVSYNGAEETLNLKTKYKQIHYVDNYTYNPNVASPELMPGTDVKQKYPFGSLGLNVGLRFNL
ncbi:MAG: outer membrane beta-barrel protein [Paludibacter sp.]|nr:outer membrane beta-barrel protein [Paludibacter sp.]